MQDRLLWFKDNVIWGLPTFLLLFGTGFYFTCKLKWIQLRKWNVILRSLFHKRTKQTKRGVTPLQATCTALAGTIGTGNIAGVTSAIALGGPGAVFWMWISSFFGMATKFAEITLSIHFRKKMPNGEFRGGPMYYIKYGLGKNLKWLSVPFCLFGILCSFGIGNMTQVNTVVASLESTLTNLGYSPNLLSFPVGLLMAGLVLIVSIGGASRIGKGTEHLVPIMGGFFLLGCLMVLFKYRTELGKAFLLIFKTAFRPQSVLGGGVGLSLRHAFRYGIGRGIFSNEAGLGSAPIAHASAETDSAVKQGFYGIIEVFVDTILLCSLTALTILTAHLGTNGFIPFGENVSGTVLMQRAFQTMIGANASGIVLTFTLFLFAFSTLLSWNLYGARCFEFLFGRRCLLLYQILYACMAILGSILDVKLIWDISDILNGLMLLPNLIAILLLSGTVIGLTESYFTEQQKPERFAKL